MTDPVTDPVLPVFVYGTLRPGGRYHDRYLGGRCERIEPAVLAGAALHDGPGYPYAVADADPTRRVRGELVTVHEAAFARVLAALDVLEECRPDGTGLYVRLRRPVTVETAPEAAPAPAPAPDLAPGPERGGAARTVAAWVYLAGPELTARLRAAPAPIHSGDWTARG
ncbi:gamma-glutamylcyclotransferase [Kitasatospora sp. NBC_01287]|uniref:gamma-glutamylcyclotransferase family protein n=1 Tax=Kitasatospora sp. NBC_01287 TaxID=2903573 RepID=UPI002256F8C8|nr:gamma-glutamylcyclotransferase family protein [Kitasatospora sp. NBC_01287]MCX4745547.1 gamma-glutamylcyclotransferase [Kitasatospora sp. NBC_01287]